MQTDPTTIAAQIRSEKDRAAIIKLALQDHRVREGELEIDDDAAVSLGCDNGAYVQAWLWVSFEDNPHLTKRAKSLKTIGSSGS